MVGEIESEQAGGLADVVTLHQQNFRLIDNVVVDVANSCATSCNIMYGSKGFPIAAIILNKRHKVLSLENTNKNLFSFLFGILHI